MASFFSTLPEVERQLLGKQPTTTAWESAWIRRPDFWLPTDREQARATLREAWGRSATERVELAGNGAT